MNKIFDSTKKHKLDSPERRELLNPFKILKEIGLKSGDCFLDIGAGIGYFTFPALEIVGVSGYVVATDVSQEMLDEIKNKIPKDIKNYQLIKTEVNSPELIDIKTDFAFLAFVLHEFNNPIDYLVNLRKFLNNDGKLVILDWKKIESEMGPPLDHRLSEIESKMIIENAGYKVEFIKEINDLQYMIICRSNL